MQTSEIIIAEPNLTEGLPPEKIIKIKRPLDSSMLFIDVYQVGDLPENALLDIGSRNCDELAKTLITEFEIEKETAVMAAKMLTHNRG